MEYLRLITKLTQTIKMLAKLGDLNAKTVHPTEIWLKLDQDGMFYRD